MKRIIFGLILLIAGTALSQTTQQKIASAQAQPSATQTPVKTKTQSLDSSNPNYRKEQKKYDGPDRDYAPRRTKTGARKDAAKGKKS